MKRRTKKALSCLLFDEDFLTTIKNVPIATFRASTTKIKKLVVGIEPVQAGSGNPSPDNVRLISGFTGCNVYRTGVNVWDEEMEQGGISSATGEDAPSSQLRTKNYISINGGAAYYPYFGNTIGGNNFQARFYDAQKNYIGYTDNSGNSCIKNVPFVSPSNAAYLRFQVQVEYGTTYNHDISINYPSTDHDYNAYVGATLPVSWLSEAGTVYAGYLSIDKDGNVILTVTHGVVSDFSNLNTNGQALSGAYRYRLVVNDCASYNDGSCICSCLTYRVSFEYANDGEFYNSSGALNIYLSDADIVSAKQTLADNNCIIVYPLATPVTYTLTSVTLPSLLLNQINNIWADTGDIIELVV